MADFAEAEGLLSLDTKIGIDLASGSTYSYIYSLQQIPDLGDTAASKERVDVTTLKDAKRRYISGIADEEDPGAIDFVFLYDSATYGGLVTAYEDQACKFVVEFPKEDSTSTAGAKVTFLGTPKFRINSVGVNEPLTFTMSVATEYDTTDHKVFHYAAEA